MKPKIFGLAIIVFLLASGFAHAETPQSVETPHANRPLQASPGTTATTTMIKCASERALSDTLYWAVEIYDQCIAVENADCAVPDFAGYPYPSRARMVQLRNQAKSDLANCQNDE